MTRRLALITRPETEARILARKLSALGFDSILEPMLFIEQDKTSALPLQGVQGYVATSVNGVRALALHDAPRTLPLWAVGEKTAQEAHDLGFQRCFWADGDLASLAALLKERVDPACGPLLRARGAHVAGDLGALLRPWRIELRDAILYRAHAATSLGPGLIDALRGGRVACALFFSPRSAESFVTLVIDAGLSDAVRSIRGFALSEAVGAKLRRLPWAAIEVPARPSEALLLDSLASCYGRMDDASGDAVETRSLDKG